MQRLQTSRHASKRLNWTTNQVSNLIPQEFTDVLSLKQKIRIKAKYGLLTKQHALLEIYWKWLKKIP
ncbi:MAG: hypothetical protein H7196_00380 [candidate division SR1 bacterium]|nr:hypothetical protein [candidate division SR1 bacterium]